MLFGVVKKQMSKLSASDNIIYGDGNSQEQNVKKKTERKEVKRGKDSLLNRQGGRR